MATNFPTSLDTNTELPVESASTPLSTNHVINHTNVRDAVKALEAKVGIDNSSTNTSLDYKLSGVTGSDKSASLAGTEALTNKTLTSPKITVGSDAVGDLHYTSNVDGTQSRLGKGTDNQILKMNGSSLNWEDETVTVNASTIAAGIVEEATQAETDAGTAAGGTSARLFVNPSTIAPKFKFGGTGADGALVITSGTTTVDLGGASYYVLNYTSVSITGTGQLAFSNPASAGTIIVIKSQGDVTLTSSTIPNIDASGMGGAGGTGSAQAVTTPVTAGSGTTGIGIIDTLGTHGGQALTGGTIVTANNLYSFSQATMSRGLITLIAGSGGGGGGGGADGNSQGISGGDGGRGGGALQINCGGALNFTSALGISVAGKNGSNGTNKSFTNGAAGTGGGGGGSGGTCFLFYNSLTAITGTINSAGGTGGTGGNATDTGGGGGGVTLLGGKGGGGAGSYAGAGGNGGAETNDTVGTAGSAAGGARAGSGGGSAGSTTYNSTTTKNGAAGGTAGASEDSLKLINYFFS